MNRDKIVSMYAGLYMMKVWIMYVQRTFAKTLAIDTDATTGQFECSPANLSHIAMC